MTGTRRDVNEQPCGVAGSAAVHRCRRDMGTTTGDDATDAAVTRSYDGRVRSAQAVEKSTTPSELPGLHGPGAGAGRT